jgi:phosphoenolpyruvate synthase/pyruvate phosphate dikinase
LSRQGIPCSSGVVVSTARVIKKYSEADKFRKNEILITHSANPGWVPLFLLATGVLTEIGGALSHSAIIAREYGIPMIASVSDACRFIKTGDLIQLDGTSGVVKILKREMA